MVQGEVKPAEALAHKIRGAAASISAEARLAVAPESSQYFRGSLTVKVLRSPTWLETSRLPSWASTMALQSPPLPLDRAGAAAIRQVPAGRPAVFWVAGALANGAQPDFLLGWHRSRPGWFAAQEGIRQAEKIPFQREGVKEDVA